MASLFVINFDEFKPYLTDEYFVWHNPETGLVLRGNFPSQFIIQLENEEKKQNGYLKNSEFFREGFTEEGRHAFPICEEDIIVTKIIKNRANSPKRGEVIRLFFAYSVAYFWNEKYAVRSHYNYPQQIPYEFGVPEFDIDHWNNCGFSKYFASSYDIGNMRLRQIFCNDHHKLDFDECHGFYIISRTDDFGKGKLETRFRGSCFAAFRNSQLIDPAGNGDGEEIIGVLISLEEGERDVLREQFHRDIADMISEYIIGFQKTSVYLTN